MKEKPPVRRAKDLKPGDKFKHRSRVKLPAELTVAGVAHFKNKVQVRPTIFTDYTFTFNKEQKV